MVVGARRWWWVRVDGGERASMVVDARRWWWAFVEGNGRWWRLVVLCWALVPFRRWWWGSSPFAGGSSPFAGGSQWALDGRGGRWGVVSVRSWMLVGARGRQWALVDAGGRSWMEVGACGWW